MEWKMVLSFFRPLTTLAKFFRNVNEFGAKNDQDLENVNMNNMENMEFKDELSILIKNNVLRRK